jgi:hypothetical protein
MLLLYGDLQKKSTRQWRNCSVNNDKKVCQQSTTLHKKLNIEPSCYYYTVI